MENIIESIMLIISKFITAAVIVFIGFVFGNIVGRFLKKILIYLNVDEYTVFLPFRKKTSTIISKGTSYTIYFLVAIYALNLFEFIGIFFEIIAIIFLIGVIITLLLQVFDFFPNVMAYFKIKKKYPLGSLVTITDVNGTIEKLSLTNTLVRTDKNNIFLYPNKYMITYCRPSKKETN